MMEVEISATSQVDHNFVYKVDLTSLLDSCRVCMAQGLKMSCIFDADKENIIEEIQFCTGIKIKQEAGLPTAICELCLNNLSIAYKFKTTCLVAEQTFHKLIYTTPIKAEEPELTDVEYEDIVEYKDESADDFDSNVKEEMIETAVEENGGTGRVKVKKSPSRPRGRPKKSTTPKPAPRRLRKFKFKRLCCEPCDLKFQTKEESDEHKRKVHKESENWICEVCGKMFNHRASHFSHVKSHQPPQYGCDQCDYKTWHKYDLVKHIRVHTGLKLYQCEYCTAAYHTSSNLTSHIRCLHMNERPHHCNICQRTFFDKTKLNRHLDSHLDIKRFECDVCHACFTRRCYWKKHLLRQHDIVTPPQRPGRQKINLVIDGNLSNTKQNQISQYYGKKNGEIKLKL